MTLCTEPLHVAIDLYPSSMERARKPYSPGAGLRPPALAGRQPQLDLWDSVMIRAERGRADRGIILHGLRGVGKTVMLSDFRQRADDRDWITGQAEAVRGEDPRVALARAFHPLLREGARRGLRKQLRRPRASSRPSP